MLLVHSENPLRVSNLQTGNKIHLEMSLKFRPSQKRSFWIWANIKRSNHQLNKVHQISNHKPDA